MNLFAWWKSCGRARGGAGQWLRPRLTELDDRVVPSLVAFGTGPGVPTLVAVYDTSTGQPVVAFNPFTPGFTGGAEVAQGDVNGDGVDDVIVGMASGGSTVIIYDGTNGAVLHNFEAFPGFTGGVNLAAGDFDGNGDDELAVGAGPGGLPAVNFYDEVNGGQLVGS